MAHQSIIQPIFAKDVKILSARLLCFIPISFLTRSSYRELIVGVPEIITATLLGSKLFCCS
jgi:hypothetical protein